MPVVLFVELGIDATNDDIVDQMRIMKRGRENGYSNIVCMIRGFNADPRELWEIPEVRAFCRRIVNLGFISYLDVSTMFPPDQPEETQCGWGAAEVWQCGEGRFNPLPHKLTQEDLEEIERVVCESNRVADAKLGPMKVKP